MTSANASALTFNRAAFQALTLGDTKLQAHLLTSFLNEADELRVGVHSASRQDETSFKEVLHRLRSVSHFVSAERLGAMLRELAKDDATELKPESQSVALRIVHELILLKTVIHQELAQHYSGAERISTLRAL